MIEVTTVVAYAVMGLISYGIMFAHWSREYKCLADDNHTGNVLMSALFSIIWPIGLPVHLLMTLTSREKFHGILFTKEKYTQHEMYPSIYDVDGESYMMKEYKATLKDQSPDVYDSLYSNDGAD